MGKRRNWRLCEKHGRLHQTLVCPSCARPLPGLNFHPEQVRVFESKKVDVEG